MIKLKIVGFGYTKTFEFDKDLTADAEEIFESIIPEKMAEAETKDGYSDHLAWVVVDDNHDILTGIKQSPVEAE